MISRSKGSKEPFYRLRTGMKTQQIAPGGLQEITLPFVTEEDEHGKPLEQPEAEYLSQSTDINAFWHQTYLIEKTPSYQDTLSYRLHSIYRILKVLLFREHHQDIRNTLADSLSTLNGDLVSVLPPSREVLINYANYLGINRNCDWKYSHGLYDPNVFPDLYEILNYEEKLIEYTTDQYINLGPIQARRKLQTKLHFSLAEAQALVLQAKNCITGEYDRDDDESRTLMRARLDNFIKRSQDALDVRAEAAALRILTVVDGLTKTTPHNINTEFRDISKKIEQEEETNYLPIPEEKPLPVIEDKD